MILFGHSFGTDFHTLVYGSILGRIIEFMLGMWMAINYKKLRSFSTSKTTLILLLSYVSFHLWCIWYLQDGGSVSESYLRILQPIVESLFGMVLILLSQLPRTRIVDAILKPLSFIGVISYPLYLTHLVVLDGVKRYSISNSGSLLSKSVGLESLAIVIGSIILAWIIHESVEKPARKLGRTIN
jgi:peptidoglycan/LPS O-acetylase OafA/YrhL